MKYTLFLTRRCNLACEYCYVTKVADRMSPELAARIIDFAFEHTPAAEPIRFGFFGGEPLLEFSLMRELVEKIEAHARFDASRVSFGVTTNGTLLSREILDFFKQHNVNVIISCDGPASIHDRRRRFADGSGSADLIAERIQEAVSVLEFVAVNAVYGPETITHLAETVEYSSSLGVRKVFLNPDISAKWTQMDVANIPQSYQAIADRYVDYYRQGTPHFISLLDHKITVMLRGGYQATEKCRMGRGEFAFTPDGEILPCERLTDSKHAIGKVDGLVNIRALADHKAPGSDVEEPCLACGIRDYCAHWCGCSNYLMTGYYNRVSSFLCESEKVALRLAMNVFRTIEAELGSTFIHHLGECSARA